MEKIRSWVRPEDMERIDSIEKANKFIIEQTEEIRTAVAEKKAAAYLFCEFRSSVAAALAAKALGDRLLCIHTDSGFIPQKVSDATVSFFREKTGAELLCIDGKESFMDVLADDLDGYAKRTHSLKMHQNNFFDETEKRGDIGFLVDSETYVQVLEQMQDAHIRVQHYRRKPVKKNPADDYELLSPLRYLYYDEVRLVGKALGLPDEIIYARPITPSGFASRCTGKITKERLEALRHADDILCEEFEKCGLADKLYQYFIIVPDIRSVGVKDGSRYEGWPAVIRAVTTRDAVTAEIGEIPYHILHAVTERIITEVHGINRVLYDLSPKPTAAIEWE